MSLSMFPVMLCEEEWYSEGVQQLGKRKDREKQYPDQNPGKFQSAPGLALSKMSSSLAIQA